MIMREAADYHGEFSETSAKVLIDSAKEFLETACEILNKDSLVDRPIKK